MNPMADATRTTRFRFWRWLIRFMGLIVPRRFRAPVDVIADAPVVDAAVPATTLEAKVRELRGEAA